VGKNPCIVEKHTMGLAKCVRKLGAKISAKLTRRQGIFGQYEDKMALQSPLAESSGTEGVV
jgi:hypothetical protein